MPYRSTDVHRTISAMAKANPVYSILLKGPNYANPTCVVAGRNPRESWLYVHAATPVALKLTPPVVRFLLDALADLPASANATGRVLD